MRRHPLAGRGEYAPGAGVEVKVPQSVDVGSLEASHFAFLEAARGAFGTRGLAA